MPKELPFKTLLAEKDYIKQVAQKLGFSAHVNIVPYGNGGNSGLFSIVVKFPNNTSPALVKGEGDPADHLETWLTYKYESRFDILLAPAPNESLTQSLIDESVSIDDENAVKNLFGDRLEIMTVLKNYVEDPGVIRFILPIIRKRLGPELDFISANEIAEKDQSTTLTKEHSISLSAKNNKRSLFAVDTYYAEKKLRKKVMHNLLLNPEYRANFVANIPSDQLEALDKKARVSPAVKDTNIIAPSSFPSTSPSSPVKS